MLEPPLTVKFFSIEDILHSKIQIAVFNSSTMQATKVPLD